ncbi:YcxB family protein, partial [Salmonella enterica]|nr:YcxB family protein [Salmonella enterica subsp. enterica serovar Montevideo]EDL3362657.1 YcxB family protein [Salmonella enterica subsp. enterica serovar Brandenburg]EDX0899916.1 YcxB family protein [Salmonella enterica subsp. enterica]EEH4905850.1 YcxB family protein [Salmonella enterica]EDM2055811.1 YcxB family protein [Salmonella enterica subsp. enterica serovar Brandenburg]
MVSKNRYSVSFTLSVFEKTEAGKLIKEREINEYIKPYDSLVFIKKTGLTILAVTAITNLILLLGLIFIAPDAPGFMERTRYFSVTILVLLAIVFGLLFIYDFL